MIESFDLRARGRAACLVLLLGVSLALRLVGPLAGLPEKDGYVAICAGGEIAYIPISQAGTGLLPDDSEEPTSEPCPWFFQFHAVAAAPASTEFITVALKSAPLPVADKTVCPQKPPASFRARAPPVPSVEASLHT